MNLRNHDLNILSLLLTTKLSTKDSPLNFVNSILNNRSRYLASTLVLLLVSSMQHKLLEEKLGQLVPELMQVAHLIILNSLV